MQEHYTFPLLSLTAPTTIITTTKPTLGPSPSLNANTLYSSTLKPPTTSYPLNAAATQPTHPDVAISLILSAEISFHLAEYTLSLTLLQRAIRCLRGHVQVAHHPQLIRAFFVMGQVLHEGQVGRWWVTRIMSR